jgi:hypothetical protein
METKNLKINCVESKLDKLTLYEPIDIKVLDKLINSDLLKVEFHNPLCKGYENEKQLLLSYKKLIKKGKAEVKYNKAKVIKYGRVNPHKALGLFSIRREIRHTLAKGTFIDIDIENCHPVILLQICEANNIETKYLKKYVNKRQRYLDQVMDYYGVSKDDAKRLFIRLLYFGKFNNWINSCEYTTQKKEIEELPFIQNFALELNQIGTRILEDNLDLRKEVEKRSGFDLELARPFVFTSRVDRYGWEKSFSGKWYYTLFIENGRVLDDEKLALKTALLEIAQTGKCNFLFTSNQNMIISDIADNDKAVINDILKRFKIIEHTEAASVIRKNAMACVALPTCPLALAEAQRYMPSLISKIEPLLEKHQLQNESIIMRMTGCPNGCARPYATEIGLVGTAPGRYNLHIGGDNEGQRLNQLFKESLDESQILTELDILFASFKAKRNSKESFGDYALRTQF